MRLRGILPIVLLAGLPAVLGGPSPLHAGGGGDYRGRRVVDVLRELEDRGLHLVFSSAVVGKDLRVREEPAAQEPRALLAEILAPLGLKAEDGPGGSILILPASPPEGTLRGHVLSSPGGRPIDGASVRLAETGLGTRSGADGSFEIRGVPPGVQRVVVEAPGFESRLERVRLAPGEEAELTAELTARSSFVTTVVVTPSRRSLVREEQTASRSLSEEDVSLAPAIASDAARAVELLPGVAAADNSAAFNVRGSLAEDSSLVLDGLELYDPFHLQSFQSPFSLIDGNVVDRIDFLGGGFTADLGDRHGGFVEIATAEPSAAGQGAVEAGTLNSRVSYGAPTATGGGSWLVSARGWYPQEAAQTLEVAGEGFDPLFGDLYAKAGFNVGPRQRISAHGLLAYDRLSFHETGEETNERADAVTRDGYAWLRWLAAWSADLTSETVLSVGRVERTRDGLSAQDETVLVDDDRRVDFFGLTHRSSWRISDEHLLKFGADLRRLDARYRYTSTIEEDPSGGTQLALDPQGTSMAAYVAHRARVLPRLTTELGVRWDRQTHTGDNQLSPRFNAVFWAGERSEMRLALGRFTQSQRIHELDVEDGETEFGGAEVSDQAELSFQHGFENGLRVRLDAYDHRLEDVRPRYENLFEPLELFPETAENRLQIAPARARLRGVELLVRGDAGRPLLWWASYALSEADDVIDGQDVPRSWDQTHAGRFLVAYRRDSRFSASLSGSIHTGWPTTPVTAEPDGSGELVVVPGERNTDRLSTYARLDVAARRSLTLAHGRLWLTAQVANLTNRENECCISEFVIEEPPGGAPRVERVFDHWLGFTPSFSVLWEFPARSEGSGAFGPSNPM